MKPPSFPCRNPPLATKTQVSHKLFNPSARLRLLTLHMGKYGILIERSAIDEHAVERT
jgi:hypothetical protein